MSELSKKKWTQCFVRRKSKLDKKDIINSEIENEEEINKYDQTQLDTLICKFSEEIFYDEESKERLLRMDINQKRILIKSSRQKFEASFEELKMMLENLHHLCIGDSEEPNQIAAEKLFDQLSAALRTESLRYVKQFVESNGLRLIFTYMRDKAVHVLNSQTFSQCIRCIRSLGNSENGYNYLLAFDNDDKAICDDPGLLEVIGKGLWSRNGITVSMIAELFGALCFSEKGWLRVMEALKYLSIDDTNYRFAILVQQFIFQENFDVKCSILSLINALAEFVQDSQDPHINRVHLRFQALRHGLSYHFKFLKNASHVALLKQIEIFVRHQQDDVKYLRTMHRLNIDHNLLVDSIYDTQMDWNDLFALFVDIKKNLAFTDSQIYLSSLLHHLLLLPLQRDNGYLYLQMVDLLIQQISIQQSNGHNPDPGLSTIQINVDELLLKLANENELKAQRVEVDNLTMECKKLNESILCLENKCFAIEAEKNAIEEQYNLAKVEVESEIKRRNEVESKNIELQNEIMQLRLQCKEVSLNVSKVDVISPSPVISAPPPPPPPPPPGPPPSLPSITVLPPPPPPGPPPPFLTGTPGAFIPPAPPPPPGLGLQSSNLAKSILSQKKIPKIDNVPLKCLNWSKIPQTKISDSIWSRIDENSLYSKIDLELLQTEFSTASIDNNFKSLVPLNPRSSPQLSRRATTSSIPVSIINIQRSQNLALKLKQARISWSKWKTQLLDCNVLNLDTKDAFQYTLAEGLIKLYPTQEEIELLEDAVTNYGLANLPEAESFMYECSRFPLYQERLICLIFFCKTPELIRRLFSDFTTLQETLTAVTNNSVLPRLFEIVLAIGNIMNQKRGVAYGFRIDSLNQLKKLKCSNTGSNGVDNLLHFVLMTIEKTNPAVFELPKKLECVQEASKINFNNIVKDLNEVGLSLKTLQSTADLIKEKSHQFPNDNFLDVVDKLLPSIADDYEELTKLQISVKIEIDKCHIFLGENTPSNSSVGSEAEDSTQKLFTELALFLSDMDASWRSVLNDRERKILIEERRNNRKMFSSCSYNGGKKGDMDNNISRLLSGDAFSKNRLFNEMRDKQS